MEARGERMYSSYSFTTSALYGGEWSESRPGRALHPSRLRVPIAQDAGWAPEPVWTQRLEENLWPLPGIEHRLSGRPVRRQTLSWLSYSGSKTCKYFDFININVDHIALGACCRLKRDWWNHETSLRISGLLAETWTRAFRLRSRRVNHSITMFIVII
jgi:hypothetical protein